MNYLLKIFKKILSNKLWLTIAVIVILGGGYWGYKYFFSSSGETVRYVTAQVQKGTLVVSISGSGQVSASTQVDVKPKVSGDVISVGVAAGQNVEAGTLLAQLDPTDAQKAIRDAESNLESARLALEKLKLSSANTDKLFDDAFANVSNGFLDLPSIITFAQEVILNDSLNPRNQTNNAFYKDFVGQADSVNFEKISLFVDSALGDYNTARKNYDAAFLLYKNTSRYADNDAIQKLLTESIKAVKSLSQALKSEQNILDFLTDYSNAYSRKLPALISTYKSTLKTDISVINSDLSNLTLVNNSIESAPLDIQSQELSVTQRESALKDAKDNLAYYSIRAPFGGVVAKLNVIKGDSASPSAAVATMVTSQRLAEISLNEVDAAKAKLKQKATLTFDAVPELSVAGEVAEIDTIGTVSQGVVTYIVKIAFNTQDERVKPGMSVSAAIITEAKQNVLLVPNSAVKQQGDVSYVEIFAGETQTPSRQNVQTGLSNDTMTEIIDGLKEGDKVVTQTVTQTASQSQPQQSSGLRIPGVTGGGGGGGGFRGGGAEVGH